MICTRGSAASSSPSWKPLWLLSAAVAICTPSRTQTSPSTIGGVPSATALWACRCGDGGRWADGQFSTSQLHESASGRQPGRRACGSQTGTHERRAPTPATNEPEPETPPPRTRGGGRTRAAGGGGDPQKRRSPSRTNAPQARTGQGANRGDDGPERRRSEPPGRATRQPRQNMWRSCCCYFVGVRAAWTDGAAVKPAQPVLFVLIPQKYLD